MFRKIVQTVALIAVGFAFVAGAGGLLSLAYACSPAVVNAIYALAGMGMAGSLIVAGMQPIGKAINMWFKKSS